MKNLTKFVAGVVVVLLIATLGATRWMKKTMFGGWTPEMKAQYASWLNDPVDVSDALKIEPPSPETVEAARAFADAFEAVNTNSDHIYNLAERYNGIEEALQRWEDHPDELEALQAEIAKYDPMLAAFETLVLRPDFVIDVMNYYEDFNMYGGVSGMGVYCFSPTLGLLGIRSWIETSTGDFDAALASCELMLRGARIRQYSDFSSSFFGLEAVWIASNNWNAVVGACEDPNSIRESLARVNARRDAVFYLPEDSQVMLREEIGDLVSMRHRGIAVDMENKTATELAIASELAHSEAIRTRVLPTLKPWTAEYEEAQDSAREIELEAGIFDRRPGSWPARLIPKPLLLFGDAWIFEWVVEMTENDIADRQSALANLDLARIGAAKRLYELERGEAASSIEALVPGYLPEAPVDRFDEAGGGYLWTLGKTGETGEPGPPIVYSIGPDLTDDHATVQYDPTNGTVGKGDIYFTAVN